MLNCFKDYKRYIHILNHILSGLTQVIKLTLEQQYMLSVQHGRYHASWCTGDFSRQCISRHGIDLQSQHIVSPAPVGLITCHWIIRDKQLWNFDQNEDIFFKKNTFSTSAVSFISFLFWTSLTHLPLDKMAAISQTILSDGFSWMKNFVFWLKFNWNLFLRVQLTINQHCLDNGLALNRRQAIMWTNVVPIHWCIYAALGGDGSSVLAH